MVVKYRLELEVWRFLLLLGCIGLARATKHMVDGLASWREELIPIVEVAMGKNNWRSLPANISEDLVMRKQAGADEKYPLNWGEGEPSGSFVLDGKKASISYYCDKDCQRSVRIAWVRREDVKGWVVPSTT